MHEVQRIKEEVDKPKPGIQLAHTFKEEFSGKKEYIVRKVEAECDHGLVVSNLEKKLRSMGLAAGNSYPMDLYILNPRRQITVLFEVKTDSTSTSCYEAIGQLFFYSARLIKKPQLVAVFPNSLDRHYIDILEEIGLQTLTYRWVNNMPCFNEHEIGELLTV